MRLETENSLKGFFFDCLADAQKNQNLELKEVTQVYLLGVLEKALSTHKIFVSGDEQVVDEPLALLFGKALASEDLFSKLELLRQIGDRSLFVSGFFSDSFIRKIIDLDYYISMGGNAYRMASNIVEDYYQDRLFPEAFSELSEKFTALVDVLGEISERSGLTKDQDLLRLYERWMFTKSKRLFEKLKDHGIVGIDLNHKHKVN